MQAQFVFDLWLQVNHTWLDYALHIALMDAADPSTYDQYYVVAFTLFVRDMDLLTELWFDIHMDWLRDLETHEAYLDPDGDAYDPAYVLRFTTFLRYAPVAELHRHNLV